MWVIRTRCVNWHGGVEDWMDGVERVMSEVQYCDGRGNGVDDWWKG